MAGEYDDYKRAVEAERREDWKRWPFRQPPLKVRLFRAIPFALSILLLIAVVMGFFSVYGSGGGLVLLCGLLFVFVLIPFLCWLVKKHTGI